LPSGERVESDRTVTSEMPKELAPAAPLSANHALRQWTHLCSRQAAAGGRELASVMRFIFDYLCFFLVNGG
jgi:hypothetical protein